MIPYRKPETIWRDMGITDPIDVDIEVIAYFCGATVKYRNLSSCAARIVGRGNKAIITVDKKSSKERQRFSIGHELGHWLQDRGEIALNCREVDLSPSRYRNFELDREAAANRFSVELLMPSMLFAASAANKPMTMDTARELAKDFHVSLTASAIRLVELGSFPAIVVCNGPQGYKWSWRHPDLPLSVKVRRLLSKHTDAYRLISNQGAMPSGPTEVDADDWVDHIAGDEYVVTEDSVRIGSQTVLTLVWWHNEEPLLDSEDYE